MNQVSSIILLLLYSSFIMAQDAQVDNQQYPTSYSHFSFSGTIAYYAGTPYTGPFETTNDNGIREVGQYLNGWKDGEWLAYRENQLIIQDHYKENKRHGLMLSWTADGEKNGKVEYQNGQMHGIYRVWTSYGKIAIDKMYDHGKECCHSIEYKYYPDHAPKSIKSYRINQINRAIKHGVWKTWNEQGHLIADRMYKDDRYDGEQKTWYQDGGIQTIANYQNRKRHGVSQHYYKGGTMSSEVYYINGKMHGASKSWFDNGELKHHSIYDMGAIVEKVLIYDFPKYVSVYDDQNREIERKYYDKNKKHALDEWRIATYKWKYRKETGEYLLEEAYDQYGKLAILPEQKVARVVYSYREDGKEVEMKRYNTKGKLDFDYYFPPIYTYKLDERGRFVELRYYNASRKPILFKQGQVKCAVKLFTYANDSGLRNSETCLGTDGKLYPGLRGRAKVETDFSENKKRLGTRRYNELGLVVDEYANTESGKMLYSRKYDKNGVMLSGEEIKYDQNENIIERKFLGAAGALEEDESGIAIYRTTFTEFNQPLQHACYDKDGKLKVNLSIGSGYAIMEYAYDQEERPTGFKYFDEHNMPVGNEYGICRAEYTYTGSFKRITYYNLLGEKVKPGKYIRADLVTNLSTPDFDSIPFIIDDIPDIYAETGTILLNASIDNPNDTTRLTYVFHYTKTDRFPVEDQRHFLDLQIELNKEKAFQHGKNYNFKDTGIKVQFTYDAYDHYEIQRIGCPNPTGHFKIRDGDASYTTMDIQLQCVDAKGTFNEVLTFTPAQ